MGYVPVQRDAGRIMYDMPAADYHAEKALSKSGLDQFRKSPAHFRAWQDGRTKNETSPALEFGSAAHCAVLEPERFILTYKLFTGDRRSKQGKEDYQLMIANGFTPLIPEQWDCR